VCRSASDGLLRPWVVGSACRAWARTTSAVVVDLVVRADANPSGQDGDVAGVERCMSAYYFDHAHASELGRLFGKKLENGRRIDLLEECAQRFDMQKKDGQPHDRARKIVSDAVRMIEREHGISLAKKRSPRGYSRT
jgi:hypothetical protein